MEPLTRPLDATVRPPGSKSITIRALVCAALADGTSVIDGALLADDTGAMLGALRALGFTVDVDVDVDGDGDGDGGGDGDGEAGRITVHGGAGAVPAAEAALDVRQSGATARFLAPVLALGAGPYRVTGHPQMLSRPMGPTFAALRELGARVEELGRPGHLPATIVGAGRTGDEAARSRPPRSAAGPDRVRLPGDVSSQFLSGLLLAGPARPGGLAVELTTDLVSRPYVDLTRSVMRAFGVDVEVAGPRTFVVPAGPYRSPARFAVEPDATAASYFEAAAAIAGGTVRIDGLGSSSAQGDVAFLGVLEAMGATVERGASACVVTGPAALRGGTFDLSGISDTAPTLAALAAFATEPVRATGIGFIRRKETDRIAAVVAELHRCGIDADEQPDGFVVRPSRSVRPAVIHTYEDHRMAMAFALLGLRAPGIAIADPGCVAKTFPGYWDALASLRGAGAPPAGPCRRRG
ncbi:MAG: 3-phosphoshikimate 1-carboxyvinyltransferase [Actinobacteria bacterium]|nr:3-phosphoshikimate 1-carboxyvinyltransferase [Actinomycetota bacterium]